IARRVAAAAKLAALANAIQSIDDMAFVVLAGGILLLVLAAVVKRVLWSRTKAHRTPGALVRTRHALRVGMATLTPDREPDVAKLGRRFRDDATFEVGSVSKTFTGVLLADLVLRGKAHLDEPL